MKPLKKLKMKLTTIQLINKNMFYRGDRDEKCADVDDWHPDTSYYSL